MSQTDPGTLMERLRDGFRRLSLDCGWLTRNAGFFEA